MPNLLEVAAPAVMKVLSVGEGTRTFVGTAFSVNDKFVLTCRHVVQAPPPAPPPARTPVLDGGPLGDVGLKWIPHDEPELDVALGVTQNATFRDWLTPVCVDVAALTNRITCVGYGSEDRGLESWSDHVGGAIRRYGLVSVQNSLHRGCSGGPCWTSSGTLSLSM